MKSNQQTASFFPMYLNMWKTYEGQQTGFRTLSQAEVTSISKSPTHPDTKGDIPFLDFNSEHINHFSPNHLLASLAGGKMRVVSAGRTIRLTNGKPTPLPSTCWLQEVYASQEIHRLLYCNFRRALDRFNESIALQLGDAKECIIWGAGEYMTHIANLEIFKRVKIVQVVDRNQALWGKPSCGLNVMPTDLVLTNHPIVIAPL